jgi:hypothetical protein
MPNKKINVDVIFLSNTKDLSLYGLTQRAINTLRWSEDSINFDIKVVESNKEVYNYGYVYEGTHVIIPDEPFGYNKFLNHDYHCIILYKKD